MTISTSGANGQRGHDGSSGHYAGGRGEDGTHAEHGRNAERNIVGVSTDGHSLNICRLQPPVPSTIESHSSAKFETFSFPLSNHIRCSLIALGGKGGDGGDGGRGGMGSTGHRGMDATRYSSATNGGE